MNLSFVIVEQRGAVEDKKLEEEDAVASPPLE